VAHENPIGEYLRARRELVRPQDIGIPDISARRRVHGLRREEVAMLAGVSSDYYIRLEQGRDQHPSPPQKVPAGIVELIASWNQSPAYVSGRYMDVLAANTLATALVPFYTKGENLVRAVFLDPRVPDIYGNWEDVTMSTVASLRVRVGPDIDDPRLNELVSELSVRSERFRHSAEQLD
jgi:transcriptional regulator with XRE-family HTH domain